jgi:hypothetical protein
MTDERKIDASNTSQIEDAVAEFVRDNPELLAALQIFGIATSEYERALSSLNPSVTYTAASTRGAR